MVEDVGANKGALISVRGFTKAAKVRAKDAGINLYTLIDAKNEEWGTYVTAPMLVRDAQLKAYSITFEGVPGKPFMIRNQNWNEMPLYREDGTFINYMRNLVLDRWEDNTIPAKPGQYNKIPLTPEDTWTEVDGSLYIVKLFLNALVTEDMRFGHIRGLRESRRRIRPAKRSSSLVQ
jgi:hypothetical protein